VHLRLDAERVDGCAAVDRLDLTLAPAAADTGVAQDRCDWPLTRTVQAPQAAIPRPNSVPVTLRGSCSTLSRGVAGSASTFTARPSRSNSIVERFLACRPRPRRPRRRVRR